MAQIENPPRKPYLARGGGVQRCALCRLPQSACICSDCETFQAQVDFLLLTHRYETYKPTNTGRLITQCLPGTQEVVWTSRTEPGETLALLLADPDRQPILIFPPAEDYADRMIEQPDPLQTAGRPLFILIDGTWRQARRIFRHSRYLQHLPVLSPSIEGSSGYVLRKSNQDEQLCTAEVAIALLHQFGDKDAAQGLQRYFDRFNSAYIATRRRWARRGET